MDVIAPAGASIQLQCKNDRGTCRDMYWALVDHNGKNKIIYMHMNGSIIISIGERYEVTESEDGVCVVNINDLQLSDAAIITCSEAVAGVDNQSKSTADVTVTGI